MGQWVRRVGAIAGVLVILGAASDTNTQEEPLGAPSKAHIRTRTPSAAEQLSDHDVAVVGEAAPMRVSMEFENARLQDVLKAFSQQTGINLIATHDINDRTVTLYLEDVTVMDALDQILEAGQLTYDRPAGSQIYIVKARPAKASQVVTVTRVYRLKFARIAKSRLARAAEALATFVPQSGGAGGGATSSSVGLGASDVGVDQIIKDLLTDVGEVQVDSRTNSLVVTDVEENFSRIESVLNALDVRTRQLLVESEVLETTISKLKDLGVEWGTGDEGALIQFTPAKRDTLFPFSNWWGNNGFRRLQGGADITPPEILNGTFDTSQAAAVLKALEEDHETKILARPKVITLDNERAVIQLTADQAIGFQSSGQAQTGTTTAEPERTTTGVSLVVTPQINDGGFVTMLVEPSVTKTVISAVTPPQDAGTVVDPKTRTTRAVVRVHDGDTLMIGGLIDRSDTDVVRRVPVLSGIPFLGEAFIKRDKVHSTSELIVFVTPHILRESSEAQSAAIPSDPSLTMRAQEGSPSRQELMERTLERLEKPL